jgi:hypothetical protein
MEEASVVVHAKPTVGLPLMSDAAAAARPRSPEALSPASASHALVTVAEVASHRRLMRALLPAVTLAIPPLRHPASSRSRENMTPPSSCKKQDGKAGLRPPTDSKTHHILTEAVVNPADSSGRLFVGLSPCVVVWTVVCLPVSCGPMVRVMVASLVSVALALVGASRTLDKCYDCNMVPPVWEMAGADGLQSEGRVAG